LFLSAPAENDRCARKKVCSRAGEKPYTAPASAAASKRTRQRRSTRNIAAADPAKPAVVSKVRLTCGPNSSVTGASTTPGKSIELFHIKLMPTGAFSAVVTRAGSSPCEIAVAA